MPGGLIVIAFLIAGSFLCFRRKKTKQDGDKTTPDTWVASFSNSVPEVLNFCIQAPNLLNFKIYPPCCGSKLKINESKLDYNSGLQGSLLFAHQHDLKHQVSAIMRLSPL